MNELRDTNGNSREKFDLQDRFVDYSVRIIKVSESLPDTKAGKHVCSQILRSGTNFHLAFVIFSWRKIEHKNETIPCPRNLIRSSLLMFDLDQRQISEGVFAWTSNKLSYHSPEIRKSHYGETIEAYHSGRRANRHRFS